MQTPQLFLQPGPADRWLGHASSRALRRAAMLALLISAAALASAGWRVWVAQQALADWQADQVQARQSAARAHPVAATDKALGATPAGLSPGRLRALNGVIERLNQPWVSLLDTLATEASAPVTLISLVADGERGSLRLEAEAPTLPPLLAYARRLQAAPLVDQLQLLRHEAQERDRLRPTRLSLELTLARAVQPGKPEAGP